jgi:small subunit ribosomal protein S24e
MLKIDVHIGDIMEIKIDSTKENKLLDRKEIEASVHFDGATPPRSEIKSGICGKIGANPDLVVLREVKNEFGIKRVRVSVHVYEDAELMKNTEPEYIIKREGFAQEKTEAKAEEAKEESKEEKPPEKKEAPKEEAKEEKAPKKKEEAPKAESKEEKPAEKSKEETKPKPETENPKQETEKPDTKKTEG